jgi:hypothetical protein
VAQGGGQIMGQAAKTLICLLGRCPWERCGIDGGDTAVGIKLDPIAKSQKLPPQAIRASSVKSQLSGQKSEGDQGMGLKQAEQGKLAQIERLAGGRQGGLTLFVHADSGPVRIQGGQFALRFGL